jgi:glycosyltransferase involved in cell wall biosynthesis
LDRSGTHGSYFGILRDYMFHNRNVSGSLAEGLPWPERIDLNCDYAFTLHDFIVQSRLYSPNRLKQRAKKMVQRFLSPRFERRFNLDLLNKPHHPLEKQALFSYIVHPFSIPRDDPRFLGHNNIWYTHEIVRVLNRMGYRVDVIDYQDTSFTPQYSYDLFLGHGGVNFSKIAQALPDSCSKVFFSTCAYWQFHNQQERSRFVQLKQRRGVDLPLDRYIYNGEDEALSLADGLIGLGNDFTRSTFAISHNIIMINNAALYDDTFDWCNKDYQEGRMHFLYYAGRGNVHKGLDLLLEAFTGMQQHLWICTLIEPKFKRIYQKELLETSNIHLVGRIKPRSRDFYRLMRLCNFCILPSASEGGAQSVVECINQGLIPLISKECGLDVEDFGSIIEPCTIEDIQHQIRRFSSYPAEQCRALSLSARQRALMEFSEDIFSRNFEAALYTLLANRPI